MTTALQLLLQLGLTGCKRYSMPEEAPSTTQDPSGASDIVASSAIAERLFTCPEILLSYQLAVPHCAETPCHYCAFQLADPNLQAWQRVQLGYSWQTRLDAGRVTGDARSQSHQCSQQKLNVVML